MTQMTRDEFAEKVFGSILGAFDTWAIYLGDKLGLYRALAEHGPMAESDLATKAGIHERYAREWLEHQTVAGVIEVDDPDTAAPDRRYSLPEAQAEVLTDRDSLAFLAPFARLAVAAGLQMPLLLEAYQDGGGVSWAQFGPDMRTGQAEMNRPWFMSELGTTWFPKVAHLQSRLEGGARVADFGCGEGWSSIAIARAYPEAVVDGYDIDAPSIEAARRHAEIEGVAGRVTFQAVDAGAGVDGEYDVVTAFECIHDLSNPVSVLRAMHQAAKEDGIVVVMDEAVGERFGQRSDEIEKLMHGFSILICLPDGMSHDGSVATGTVMRPSTLETYARAAGFSGVDVLPIENDLWRFYELTT